MMRMDNILEQVLIETGCAYLVVDSAFRVRTAGGCTSILSHGMPSAGESLFHLIPELIGNEAALADILAGRISRLSMTEINRETNSGALYYVDLLTVPNVAPDGSIDGLLQIVTDVTHRGMIEQTHVQQRNELRLLKDHVSQQNIDLARTNAELRRANRLKDEFLAGISHEVRTPLTAVLGLSELLRMQIVGPLNDEQTDMVRRIDESGHHLLAVINDLLDLAKIESGRFDLDRQIVSVQHLCDASIRMINELAIRKGLTVQVRIHPAAAIIRADERRLRQALINLLSNAVKFTPEGTVGLEFQGDADGELVRFTVWDTGIGIAADDIPRLFQPFSQIDSDYQRSQVGTGLGLVMVARLAELHGGGVSLQSELGRGSRFTISLPWPAADQLSSAEEEQSEAVGGRSMIQEPESIQVMGIGQTILVVEDDVVGAGVVMEYLRHAGYRATHVASGEEALASIRHEPPQLIIVDLRMRTMDGLETMRRIRASYATRATPMIALTALAMPGDRERSLEAGANAYLSKPVHLKHLAETIAELLV